MTLNSGKDLKFWISVDKLELLLIEFELLASNDIFLLNSNMEVQVELRITEPYLTSQAKRNQVWSGIIWYIVDHCGENIKEFSRKSLQITTDYPETTMAHGTMFDIRVHKDIVIRSIDFNTSVLNELIVLDIWTKVEQATIA